jgi:hypothetical protein
MSEQDAIDATDNVRKKDRAKQGGQALYKRPSARDKMFGGGKKAK